MLSHIDSSYGVSEKYWSDGSIVAFTAFNFHIFGAEPVFWQISVSFLQEKKGISARDSDGAGSFRLSGGLFFEAVQPVWNVIIDQIDRRTDGPGDGIRPVKQNDVVADLHGHGNVNDAQQAPDRQHDDHGNKGLPGTAQDGYVETKKYLPEILKNVPIVMAFPVLY